MADGRLDKVSHDVTAKSKLTHESRLKSRTSVRMWFATLALLCTVPAARAEQVSPAAAAVSTAAVEGSPAVAAGCEWWCDPSTCEEPECASCGAKVTLRLEPKTLDHSALLPCVPRIVHHCLLNLGPR